MRVQPIPNTLNKLSLFTRYRLTLALEKLLIEISEMKIQGNLITP